MKKPMTEAQVREMISSKTEEVGLRELARQMGMTAGYLCDIVHGRRNVSDVVAGHFGLKRRERVEVDFVER